MRSFVSLINIEDEDQIEAAVAELLEALGGKTEEVTKHTPGGVDHDQSKHGSWAHGQKDGPSSPSSSSAPQSPPKGNSGGPSATFAQPKSPPEDAAFIRSIIEKNLAIAGPRLAQVEAEAGQDQMSSETHRGEDTMGMYGEWNGNEFQGYTEERDTWQPGILAQMQQEQIVKNGRMPGQDCRAVIMAGLPGSGKSHLISTDLNQYVDTREFLTINADDIKEKIIFEDTPPTIGNIEGWELAAMAHEESSTMRKVWENAAMESGTNIILDITAANGGKTQKLLQSLKAKGYDVTIVHVDTTPDEARASALRRAVVGGDPSKGTLGRVVSSSFIDGMRSGDGDVIDENFDDYLPHADRAYWFRTYPLNVERSANEQKPTELLWSG